MYHIVAKADWRAAPAREVLRSYGINVWTYKRNLIAVSADRHARLHTNRYFHYVNMMMIQAGRRGKKGIDSTYDLLRDQINHGTIIR